MFKIAKFDGKAVRDKETRASQVALVLKNPHAGVAVQELQEMQIQPLGGGDPVEEGLATYSCLQNFCLERDIFLSLRAVWAHSVASHAFLHSHGNKRTTGLPWRKQVKQREPFQAALWLMGTTLAKEADWLEKFRASTQTPLNARG